MSSIKPVILSGGSGTRLWPLSRKMYPKQFLPLVNDKSMLQETVERLQGLSQLSESITVVCNEEHRFLVAEQIREINVDIDHLILEPEGRNTAPALTLAALSNHLDGKDDYLLVLPADHSIRQINAFQDAISEAVKLAEKNYLVTFGIVPTRAETGYGYIQLGDTVDDKSNKINQFVEKPDHITAQQYLDSGDYLWNSGMFMMKTSVWLESIRQFQPEILRCCEAAMADRSIDQDFLRPGRESFKGCPSDSIDYAVMEKVVETSDMHAAVIPLDAGWSDVGAWTELWNLGEKDEHGNVTKGDVVSIDTKDSMVFGRDRLIATIGVENAVIVETVDAVLVANKDNAQDIKKIVELINEQERGEHLHHRCVYRPWGNYDSIDNGHRFQEKRITVKPGAALSLQMHQHRAEHWIVVTGTAKVTRGEEVFLVGENESTYIPIGMKHRLENPGTIPLEIIEVQPGSYLGEDDITRFDDVYG
ncbi:MAG: mannose-1-phosphate guanylyltransferase/mannose-6-phosphate isomerase, partial [Gammaproteobacteria bacterium]